MKKKKCIKCKKLLDIKFFSSQWNKRNQKYDLHPRCRPCFRMHIQETYNDPGNIKIRNKYLYKGYYGWNIYWERYMCMKDGEYRLEASRVVWTKKIENITEISRVMVDKLFKYRKKIIPENLIYKRFQKRVLKELSKHRKFSGIPYDVVQQVIYYKLMTSEGKEYHEINLSSWDKKMHEMTKHTRTY